MMLSVILPRRRRCCCSPRDELNVMCSFILPSADSCFLIEYDKCHSFPLSVRWTIHPFTPYITFLSLKDQNSVVRQVQHPSWHCVVGFQRCQWHERTMRDDERRNREEENVPLLKHAFRQRWRHVESVLVSNLNHQMKGRRTAMAALHRFFFWGPAPQLVRYAAGEKTKPM